MHGLFSKGTVPKALWNNAGDFFCANGIIVGIGDYSDHDGLTREPLSVCAERLKPQIKKFKPKVIVAHSAGGIIARYLMQMRMIEPVQIIFLETPHQGLYSWQLRFFRASLEWLFCQDLLRNSNFLAKLNEVEHTELTLYYVAHLGGFYSCLTPWIFYLKGLDIVRFFSGHYLMNCQKALEYMLKIIQEI